MTEALANPIALLFMVEALVIMAFGAWWFGRHGLKRPGWVAFVILTMVGSLAFSIPFCILLHVRKGKTAESAGSI